MTKHGVLFDLDGVLVDSETLYTQLWAGIDETYPTGIPNFAAVIKGTTLPEILTHFPEEVRDDIVNRVHDFEAHMQFIVYPGVLEFLESLHDNGIPMAIVTSSDDVKMNLLFSQHPEIKSAVDVVITGSDVKKSKPDPEGYLAAAKAIGRNPENCFVFEDSLQGLEAGRRSGATVIALATTNSREVLKGKACEIIDGLAGFTVEKMLSLVNRL